LLSNYDWKEIDSNPLWFLESLCQRKRDLILEKFTEGMTVQEKTKAMLEYLSKFEPEKRFEDYGAIRERLEIFRKNLNEYCLENNVKDGELLVISHCRTLQTLTCTEFDNKGKPVDGKFVFFKNAQILEWDFDL